jgi:hypothetical protein
MSEISLNLNDMKVEELKAELSKRNLNVSGIKRVLFQRLETVIDLEKTEREHTIGNTVAAEKAVADKLIVDKAIADKLIVEKAIANKAIADQASNDGNGAKRRRKINPINNDSPINAEIFVATSKDLLDLMQFSVAEENGIWWDELSGASTSIVAVAKDNMQVGDSFQVVEGKPDEDEVMGQIFANSSHYFIFHICGIKADGMMMLSYIGGTTAKEMADELFITPVGCPPGRSVQFEVPAPSTCRKVSGRCNSPIYRGGIVVEMNGDEYEASRRLEVGGRLLKWRC